MTVIADVAVGDQLPELVVPLSRTLIVSTAIASRDYQDVHHDPDIARERGSEDIFMNILTSNGLAERFVREWAGDRAILRRLSLRLGAPNYPGDTMTCTGEVVSIADDGACEVSVRCVNSRGIHASGTAVVQLPFA